MSLGRIALIFIQPVNGCDVTRVEKDLFQHWPQGVSVTQLTLSHRSSAQARWRSRATNEFKNQSRQGKKTS